MRRAKILVIILSLLAPFETQGTPGDSPDSGTADEPAEIWMKHLRGCQKGVFSIRADFVQERFHKLRPSPEAMEGTAEVRRGGRIRLEYSKPSRRLVASDGETLWAYDHLEKTAFKSDTKRSLIFKIFDFILNSGNGDFWSRHLGGASNLGKGPAAVELIPRIEDPVVKSFVLTLDENCPCVKRVLVVDHTGAVTRVTLSNIQTNVKMGKRRFTFKPPRGTTVVKP